jgi:hypothetical protein
MVQRLNDRFDTDATHDKLARGRSEPTPTLRLRPQILLPSLLRSA